MIDLIEYQKDILIKKENSKISFDLFSRNQFIISRHNRNKSVIQSNSGRKSGFLDKHREIIQISILIIHGSPYRSQFYGAKKSFYLFSKGTLPNKTSNIMTPKE